MISVEIKSNLASDLECLVKRIIDGERLAENQLAKILRPVVLGDLARRGLFEESEDVAHEALIIGLKRLREGTLESPNRIRYFVVATACNIAIANRRRSSRRKLAYDSPAIEVQISRDSEVETSLLEQRTAGYVHLALGRLTIERDAYILRRLYLDEAERNELCLELDLSAEQLSRCLYKARRRLRNIMAAEVRDHSGLVV